MLKKVDCLFFYVDNLDKWISFYRDKLWLELKWKWKNDAGFILWESELVIQTREPNQEVDILVDDVLEAVDKFKKIWATIIEEPFDINIWKCAIIQDLWWNTFTILDTTKWLYKVDDDKNIIWLK
jgi:catechol 2,3-dioxygenase-like lactoylglutathione lyase family enzyme